MQWLPMNSLKFVLNYSKRNCFFLDLKLLFLRVVGLGRVVRWSVRVGRLEKLGIRLNSAQTEAEFGSSWDWAWQNLRLCPTYLFLNTPPPSSILYEYNCSVSNNWCVDGPAQGLGATDKWVMVISLTIIRQDDLKNQRRHQKWRRLQKWG